MSLDDVLGTASDIPSVFQHIDRRRAELRADILAASVRRGQFVRASGSVGADLIDPHAFQTYPTVLRRAAALAAELLPAGVDRLAGREGAGIPLMTALSLHTGLPFAVVGESRRSPVPCVAGEIHPGERVVLVEPVTFSGSAAVRGTEWIRALGGDPLLSISIVDRGGGAAAALAAAGCPLRTLFTIDDLHQVTSASFTNGAVVNKSNTPVDLGVALSAVGTGRGPYGRTLNTGADPAVVEAFGEAFADRLRGYDLDVLVIWDSSDDAVLAHAVAHRLRITVVRAFEESGLLFFDHDIAADARAALLATVWDSYRLLSSLTLLAGTKGARVVLTAAVIGTPQLSTAQLSAEQDMPTLCLIEGDR